MYAVYALIDPRDNTVRYVGMTDNVYARFLQHIRGMDENLAKGIWIQELKALNKMVIMETLEECETSDLACERESYWIRHFEMLQEPLMNISKTSSPRRAKRTNLRLGRNILLDFARATVQANKLKKVEKEEVILQSGKPDDYTLALAAWNDGHQSVRKLAAALNVSEAASYRILREMDQLGMIQMKRK